MSDITAENAARLFSRGQYLLGDCGYPLLLWLLTPFRDNGQRSEADKAYNCVLSSMCVDVERTFGHLKGRFPSLHSLNTPLESMSAWVNACCVLHNFCIEHNDSLWARDIAHDDTEPTDHPASADANGLHDCISDMFL